MSWPTLQLQEMTEPERPITYGVVKPGQEDIENGVRFVRGGDIKDGKINTLELRTITQETSKPYSRTLLRGGEMLISLVGNPGEVAIVPQELAGANIARQAGLVALRPEFHSRFIMYFLRSPVGRAELFQRTKGAVQQVINLADLKTVNVPQPDLPTQERIAAILSAYDDLIANNRRRIALLEQAARLLYREWFVHFRFPGHETAKFVDGLPEGWELRSIGEHCPFVYGKALTADTRIAGGVDVYGSSGIVGKHNKKLVDGNAIVIGRKGNVGSIFWARNDFWPIDTAYYVAPKNSDLFTFHALENVTFINTDVAVPGLNRNFAHSRLLAIPDDDLLVAFNNQVGFLMDQTASLKNQAEKLTAARDLLLPRLMDGRIPV